MQWNYSTGFALNYRCHSRMVLFLREYGCKIIRGWVNDRAFIFGMTGSFKKRMITCVNMKTREFMLKSSVAALYSTVHSGSWLDCTVIKAYHRGCICRLPWPKQFALMDGHFHCLLTLNEACSSGLNWMLYTVSSYSPQPAFSPSLSLALSLLLFLAFPSPLCCLCLLLFLRLISDELWLKRAEPNTHIFTHTV